jgi:stringent starvation protein B
MVANPPPSKKEHLHKLLERGSVFVHLDPRREGVSVPTWLAKKPQLVLQLGLNFPIPIRDLEIDDDGVRCTLSFNRAPFYCVLPWSAVYALVAEDGQVTVWPSDLPSELVPQIEPAMRRGAPRERRDRRDRRPRISVVPTPRDGSSPSATTDVPLCPADSENEDNSVSGVPQGPVPAVARADGESEGGVAAGEPATGVTRPARERPPYLRLVK